MAYTLSDFKTAFSNDNANTLNTAEEVDENFTFHPSLEAKFLKLYKSMKEFENTLILGARGVGKTLFLKKIKYDYIKKGDILPVYVDLSDLRLILTLSEKSKHYDIINFYLNCAIIKEFIESALLYFEAKNAAFGTRFRKFFHNLCQSIEALCFGEKQNDDTKIESEEELENIKLSLLAPFNQTKIEGGEIQFVEPIVNLLKKNPQLEKWIQRDISEVIQDLITKYDFKKILILIDEFSWLQEKNQQEIIAEQILSLSKKFDKNVKFKISIMQGMFRVDLQKIQFDQHAFSYIYFEMELKDIFEGTAYNDQMLSDFYFHIFNNRLKVANLKVKIDQLFEPGAFLLLSKYSGFKIRDFINFVKEICNSYPEEMIIKKDYVHEICNTYYPKIISQLNLSTSELEFIYLQRVVNALKGATDTSKYYYNSTEPLNDVVNVLVYYKIISIVSDSNRIKGKARAVAGINLGFLLDLSTAVNLRIRTKNEVENDKYLSFSYAPTLQPDNIDSSTKIKITKQLAAGVEDSIIIDTFSIDQAKLNQIKAEYKRNQEGGLLQKRVTEDQLVKNDRKRQAESIELWHIRFFNRQLANFIQNLGYTYDVLLKLKPEEKQSIWNKLPSTGLRIIFSRAKNNNFALFEDG